MSTIVLGLAMVVPLKASAQGVTIYVGPVTQVTVLVTRPMRLIPPPMATAIQATVMPIQATATATAVRATATATATATAVRATALIGAKVDALRAEFIGDMTAGS